MARGSGPAGQGFLAGQLMHQPSGVEYQVLLRDGAAWMFYHRAGDSPAGPLDGEHKLEYFIGSGAKGRTFLYQQEGYWYEASDQLLHAQKRLGDGA